MVGEARENVICSKKMEYMRAEVKGTEDKVSLATKTLRSYQPEKAFVQKLWFGIVTVT